MNPTSTTTRGKLIYLMIIIKVFKLHLKIIYKLIDISNYRHVHILISVICFLKITFLFLFSQLILTISLYLIDMIHTKLMQFPSINLRGSLLSCASNLNFLNMLWLPLVLVGCCIAKWNFDVSVYPSDIYISYIICCFEFVYYC